MVNTENLQNYARAKFRRRIKVLPTSLHFGNIEGDHTVNQRPYRKDRLPRDYFCCRQLAKFIIVRGSCLYNMLHWLVCNKPAGQSFPDFGEWVSVDFDSKYKTVWGETRDHRIPILEEIKKLKKKEST